MNFKKFGFQNFDYIIRFAIKNESEIEHFRSRDQRIFQENRFYEIETLTHNLVNTISDKCNWTGSSDSECDQVPLTKVYIKNILKIIFVSLGSIVSLRMQSMVSFAAKRDL